jgi:C4-type Zn-finger protein
MESNKYKINLNEIRCPKCDEQMPLVRVPENIQELMWGGWTCPKCGCKMDKFGKSIDGSNG